MKNKSQSWGCAEAGLRHGVISVGRVGSAGVTAGERIKGSHPDKRTWLCKGRGKGEAATGGQVSLGWFYPWELPGWLKDRWDLEKMSTLVVSLSGLCRSGIPWRRQPRAMG